MYNNIYDLDIFIDRMGFRQVTTRLFTVSVFCGQGMPRLKTAIITRVSRFSFFRRQDLCVYNVHDAIQMDSDVGFQRTRPTDRVIVLLRPGGAIANEIRRLTHTPLFIVLVRFNCY